MSARAKLRRLASDRGAAAVEFALIIVPLVLLLVGVLDFGRVLYLRNNMIEAADVGARVILLDNAATNAEVEDAVQDAFLAGSGSVAFTPGTASENGIDFRTITIEYDVDLVTPLLVVDTIALSHTRRVPLE